MPSLSLIFQEIPGSEEPVITLQTTLEKQFVQHICGKVARLDR